MRRQQKDQVILKIGHPPPIQWAHEPSVLPPAAYWNLFGFRIDPCLLGVELTCILKHGNKCFTCITVVFAQTCLCEALQKMCCDRKPFKQKKILPSLWCNMVVCLAQPRLHWPSYRLTMFVFSLRPFFLHLYQHILFIGFFTAAVQLSTVCSMLHRPVPTTSTAMSLPSSPTAGFTITRGSVLEL